MAESEVSNQASAIATAGEEAPVAKYRMSREGRRQAIILLLGVASIWIFALWSLVATVMNGLGGAAWVSALLLLAIVVVAPLVGWSLLEESSARITTGDEGLRFESLAGLALSYTWQEVTGIKPKPRSGRLARFFLGENESSDAPEANPAQAEPEASEIEPGTVLVGVRQEHTVQIANPVVRFLHSLSYGAAVPVFGGLENRDSLLADIASRCAPR